MSAPSATHAPPAQEAAATGSLLDEVIQKTETNIDVMAPDALSGLTRAEIDIQISTAKRFPRSLKTFLSRAITMATVDVETAASCMYSLPRGGKPITGPSVRLAEIMASAWGNLRMAARLVAEESRYITAQGMCHDLEANNAITMDVQRRITGKNGKKFADDMIVVTGNAAASIALRNAILRIIPRAYVNQVYEAARKTATGDAKTITQRRAEMVAYFGKMGVTPERVAAAVEKASIEDIDADALLALRGYANSIKDGTADIDEVFPEPAQDAAARASDVLAKAGVKDPTAGTTPPGGISPAPPAPEAQAEAKPPAEPDREPGDNDEPAPEKPPVKGGGRSRMF